MKYFLSLLLCLNLFGDNQGPLYSPSTANTFKQEQETISTGVSKDISTQIASSAMESGSNQGTSDVMIVDPKAVSKDWQDAFNSLKAKKLTDIIFILRDHSQILNVSDIEALPGGYLMLFSLRTVQGVKYKIVKTSDIVSISSK